MRKETREALNASIKSWESHVKHDGYDDGAESCALCTRFDEESADDDRCVLIEGKNREKCPIYAATGNRGCVGTAFYDHGFGVDRAQSMLRFLKSLL